MTTPLDAAGPDGSTTPGQGQRAPANGLQTATLILNPRAGRQERTIERVIAAAADVGWSLRVQETAARAHATELAAAAAARGDPVVLVGGGDGTLNEVLQAVAGTETAVGAIPFGTMNVWIRELGLSLDPAETVRQLLTGEVRRIDLGRVNGRYFLLMAGIGFDADAIHALEENPNRNARAWLFFLTGMLAALRTRGQRVQFQADGEAFETNAALVTVGNTRLWAGAVKITHRATAADGLLDVCIFPGRSIPLKLWYLALVLIGRHDDHPDVIYRQVRSLTIATRPPVSIQLDGEPAGETPAAVEVVPGAVLALVGSGQAAALADAPVERSLSARASGGQQQVPG
ncbi:MAG: diacylglycerol kinase family lipid kinase [Chloroflexi bacterium]|nr:diacylglycerol kinase family lipid kinase [Chloroflexota bacterium]